MSLAYADTSFLTSVYSEDANSKEALRIMRRHKQGLFYTSFHQVELHNAIRLRVYRKQITQAQRSLILANIESDFTSGILRFTLLSWESVFMEAERLSALHAESLGIRSLDLLHVASAVTLGAKVFLTFDVRQKTIVKKAGLKLKP